MAKKPVTNRLRVLRAEHGVTQLEAALETDIGPTRYWKIENDYATPTPRERQALRRLFRVADAEMFPDSGSGGGASSNGRRKKPVRRQAGHGRSRKAPGAKRGKITNAFQVPSSPPLRLVDVGEA